MTTMTETETTTFPDVLAFIASQASSDEVSRIFEAGRQRSRMLRTVQAASVSIGANVVLDNISPKYLNGLTGTVVSIKGARAEVLLDETSTTRLRYSGGRFFVPADETNHRMPGVPLTACVLTAD